MNTRVFFARALLGTAVIAMAILHVVQAELDPWQEPVSFYVHGQSGWLLPLALATFGAAAVLVSVSFAGGARAAGILLGAGMLLASFAPSERHFPWEAATSVSGWWHAGVSVLAPPALVWPMLERRSRAVGTAGAIERAWVWGYIAALVLSAASLTCGFAFDRAPPWIGLAERLLAACAVGWLWQAAPARPG